MKKIQEYALRILILKSFATGFALLGNAIVCSIRNKYATNLRTGLYLLAGFFIVLGMVGIKALHQKESARSLTPEPSATASVAGAEGPFVSNVAEVSSAIERAMPYNGSSSDLTDAARPMERVTPAALSGRPNDHAKDSGVRRKKKLTKKVRKASILERKANKKRGGGLTSAKGARPKKISPVVEEGNLSLAPNNVVEQQLVGSSETINQHPERSSSQVQTISPAVQKDTEPEIMQVSPGLAKQYFERVDRLNAEKIRAITAELLKTSESLKLAIEGWSRSHGQPAPVNAETMNVAVAAQTGSSAMTPEKPAELPAQNSRQVQTISLAVQTDTEPEIMQGSSGLETQFSYLSGSNPVSPVSFYIEDEENGIPLADSLQQSVAEQQTVAILEEQIRELKALNASLTKEKGHLVAARAVENQALDLANKNSNQALNVQAEQARAIEAFEAQLLAMQQKEHGMQQKIEKLDASQKQLTKEKDELSKANEALRLESAKISEELRSVNENRDKLDSAKKEQAGELQALQAELQTMQQAVTTQEELIRQLSNKQAELKEANDKLSEEKVVLQLAQESKDMDLGAVAEGRNRKINTLQQEHLSALASLQSELQAMQLSAETTAQEIEALEQFRSALQDVHKEVVGEEQGTLTATMQSAQIIERFADIKTYIEGKQTESNKQVSDLRSILGAHDGAVIARYLSMQDLIERIGHVLEDQGHNIKNLKAQKEQGEQVIATQVQEINQYTSVMDAILSALGWQGTAVDNEQENSEAVEKHWAVFIEKLETLVKTNAEMSVAIATKSDELDQAKKQLRDLQDTRMRETRLIEESTSALTRNIGICNQFKHQCSKDFLGALTAIERTVTVGSQEKVDVVMVPMTKEAWAGLSDKIAAYPELINAIIQANKEKEAVNAVTDDIVETVGTLSSPSVSKEDVSAEAFLASDSSEDEVDGIGDMSLDTIEASTSRRQSHEMVTRSYSLVADLGDFTDAEDEVEQDALENLQYDDEFSYIEYYPASASREMDRPRSTLRALNSTPESKETKDIGDSRN